MFKLLGQGIKAIAVGRAQQKLGVQSPYLPGAIVRLGRFLYVTSGLWLTGVWYTGYANMRTQPGSGPQLVLPGKPVIGPPDRPGPTAAWAQQGQGGSSGGGSGSTNPGPGGYVNPFSGSAIGGRLDQGFDLTSKIFNAPARSKIVAADQSNSGWQGGGVVAGLILSGPRAGKVWGFTEGVSPVVRVGQIVNAGDRVAIPVSNPYNGSVGNIEAGWMNPSAPSQPLAQVSSNRSAVSWDFYHWIRSLGGPTASSTGNAGFP